MGFDHRRWTFISERVIEREREREGAKGTVEKGGVKREMEK